MLSAAVLGLNQLISDTPEPRRVAEYLDGLAPAERIAAVRNLDSRAQQRLWTSAEGFAPATLADLVPSHTPPLSEVRHYGKNSLPLFTHFEKRFYRSADGQVAGANFQSMSPFTGPGYFLVHEDSARRELVLDYRSLPSHKPEAWPAIASNERGISRLVYGFMIDVLRRVSTHVTIGRAARNDQPLDNWFVLCREEQV